MTPMRAVGQLNVNVRIEALSCHGVIACTAGVIDVKTIFGTVAQAMCLHHLGTGPNDAVASPLLRPP